MSTLAQTNGSRSANLKVCFQPNWRGAAKALAALQDRVMVGQIAVIRVISFLLLVACGALCQNEHPSADFLQELQFDASKSSEVQSQELRTWRSLPDAPSVQHPTQAEKFHLFIEEAGSPLAFGAAAINTGVMREEVENSGLRAQPGFTALYRAAVLQKESSVFFGKYLYPLLLKQDPRYHPSNSESILGRTVYAASRVLITRNDSGKRTLNSSYLLGVLTSAAVATAYRPYRPRSPSSTFKDLGSTIGCDAGINVFHEFWPGIRQILKRHEPKFVSRIEERITNDHSSNEVVSAQER